MDKSSTIGASTVHGMSVIMNFKWVKNELFYPPTELENTDGALNVRDLDTFRIYSAQPLVLLLIRFLWTLA